MSAARSCRCGAQRAEPVIAPGRSSAKNAARHSVRRCPPSATPVANVTVTPPSATELRVASVLFVDLVDFAGLAESRDAEDVRELFSGYLDAAGTIVERYRGAIEKFIGDAVMAVWGVPKAREDDAERRGSSRARDHRCGDRLRRACRSPGDCERARRW